MACPGHSLDVGDRGREDDGAAPVNERRELLDREERPLGVEVENLVVDGLGDVREGRWGTEPCVDEAGGQRTHDVSGPEQGLGRHISACQPIRPRRHSNLRAP